MKKILFVLMMCVSVLCLALGLSACKEQIDTPQTDLPQDGYSENGLKFVLNSGGDNYTVLGGRFDGEHLIVPSTFNNVPVTSVGESAFKGNNRLRFIEIPNSITSIEKQAFEDCSELEAINVDLQNPNYSSQDGILYNKERTKFIHIPKAIKGTITISENVISIGDSAFYKCNNLQGVSFGNNSKLTSIGEYAFEQCGRLQSITIPKSVTWIGDYAFCKCDSLQNIEIPEGVISVGDHAFKNCSGLTSIIIPDSVSSIGSSVFEGTAYENNEDNWTGQVLYIGNHLIEARIAISGEYSIRQGTKTIAGDAFYDCVGLTSVTMPNGVTLIGRYAFKGCNGLQDIEIPCSVALIESAAFRGCSSLQSVLFEDNSGLTEIGEGHSKIADYGILRFRMA